MSSPNGKKLDLNQVRETLANKQGPEYWRSLEEVASTAEFEAWVEDEFPNRSSIMDIDRRDFIKFMGASMMLAGMAGCRSLVLPTEKIVPYVNKPEDIIPGKPLQFATAMAHKGSAIGLLVTSYEGRPVKIEGNPDHPESLGKTDYFAQAAILDLYDPERGREVYRKGLPSNWEILFRELNAKFAEMKSVGYSGVAILTESVTSPTVAKQLQRIQNQYAGSKVYQYDAVSPDSMNAGLRMASGSDATPVYDLSAAETVISLDGDFLHEMADSVRMANQFMIKRNSDKMNRLYAVESSPNLTGAMADHRRAVKPSQVESYARAIAIGLGISVPAGKEKVDQKFVDAAVADLKKGGLIIPGLSCSPLTHALAAVINQSRGSVQFRPSSAMPQAMLQLAGLQALAADMQAGKVTTLIIIGGNPVFDAPANLMFGERLAKVEQSIHFSTHPNETSKLCTFAAPSSHFLEAWGDVQTLGGVITIQQPLIAPLFNTKSEIEFLAGILNTPKSGYEIIKESYGVGKNTAQFDTWLHRGTVEMGQDAAYSVTQTFASSAAAPAVVNGTQIAFRPDPTIWDGRHANNGWLQELPKPLTTLTWDNPALVSPSMMARLDAADGDHVKIEVGKASITIPVLKSVGHPDDVVTIFMGGGRTEVGGVGAEAGVNTFPIRTDSGFWMAGGVKITKVPGKTEMAVTQVHHSMEGRDIIREYTAAQYAEAKATGEHLPHPHHHVDLDTSMYPDEVNTDPITDVQWGMTIDLNVCTGCHACVSACQAENNIPVVGKRHVHKGREMHWIRIDRYYRVTESGKMRDAKDQLDTTKFQDVFDGDSITTVMMPLTCMHCELAPCEPVCPVAATVHSHEGLNQMVYNRCVGTRYCSNNCPYKVRRFNYLNYTDNQAQFMDRADQEVNLPGKKIPLFTATSSEKPNGRALLKLMNNPNVTVRGRGVMEKCTYCVQRINKARIDAKKDQRPIKDGEVVTACQQACPSGAITFGNIADKKSAVTKTRNHKRSYSLLPELNTRNRTTYLAKLRNPNPELEQA